MGCFMQYIADDTYMHSNFFKIVNCTTECNSPLYCNLIKISCFDPLPLLKVLADQNS